MRATSIHRTARGTGCLGRRCHGPVTRPAADLHEAGDLENTADSVIGLYRDELAHADSPDKGLAGLIVLKKRQFGDDVGTTRRLVWVGESYRDYAYQR